MNKFTLALDSSQIHEWYNCEERWKQRYYRRLTPIEWEPDEEAMNAGTYGHYLLEIWYRGRARQEDLNTTIQRMYEFNPDVHTCECGCICSYHRPLPILPNVQECQKCKRCAKFRPKPFNLKEENRAKVRDRLLQYIAEYYHSSDIVPDSENHLEVGFAEPLFEDSENLFVIEGRIDVIGTYQGIPAIMDHKFQMVQRLLYPRSIQFKTYALVARRNLFIINYVRLHKDYKKGVTLARVPVN